ncbi:MAG: hypothetical protein IKI13_09370 [Bacteroidales bacterium]|nr:hypothetical protein [Bacteroidales bacterium]
MKHNLLLFLVIACFPTSIFAQDLQVTPQQGVALIKQGRISAVLEPILEYDVDIINGQTVFSEGYEPDAKYIAFDPSTKNIGLVPVTGPRSGQVISWSAIPIETDKNDIARFYAYTNSGGFEIYLTSRDDLYIVVFFYREDLIVAYSCK